MLVYYVFEFGHRQIKLEASFAYKKLYINHTKIQIIILYPQINKKGVLYNGLSRFNTLILSTNVVWLLLVYSVEVQLSLFVKRFLF